MATMNDSSMLTAADSGLATTSESELMARVVAGMEPAAAVLAWAERLARVPFWERRSLGAAGLTRQHRIPAETAVRLAALWELAERWYPDERPAIASARDAALLLDDLRAQRREHVVVVLLDARHRPMWRETVAIGTINASRLLPRDVLAPALRRDAVGVLVGHNHPSGDPTPSRADRIVTSALRNAAELVGMALVDHVIVASTGHYSFRESEGWDRSQPHAA